MYKEYMLIFNWTTSNTKETFYFDTKEDMIKFINVANGDIKVEAMFHLEKIS